MSRRTKPAVGSSGTRRDLPRRLGALRSGRGEKHAVSDREGIQQVFRAVDLLADNPRPSGAFTVGASGIYRIQAGFYRVQYEIHDQTVTVTVFHLGRA